MSAEQPPRHASRGSARAARPGRVSVVGVLGELLLTAGALILLETRSRSRRGLQIGLLIGLAVVLYVIGTVVARWKIGAF